MGFRFTLRNESNHYSTHLHYGIHAYTHTYGVFKEVYAWHGEFGCYPNPYCNIAFYAIMVKLHSTQCMHFHVFVCPCEAVSSLWA